jgi:hypothetical protein
MIILTLVSREEDTYLLTHIIRSNVYTYGNRGIYLMKAINKKELRERMEHNTNDSKMGTKVKDRLADMAPEKLEEILSNFQGFK